MKLHNPTAELFVPDSAPIDAALKRTTHLGIRAHHNTDQAKQLIFGMDLTSLVSDVSLEIIDFVCDLIKDFEMDVRKNLSARLGFDEPL
jgi:hypothetical protein